MNLFGALGKNHIKGLVFKWRLVTKALGLPLFDMTRRGLFCRIPGEIGQAADKEVLVAFDQQKVAGRENVSPCSLRQPDDSVAYPEGLALPAHLFERAHSPGQLSGRPPAFDFDCTLSAVGEASQQIDIAELPEGQIGINRPNGRRGGDKSFDGLLLDDAPVPAARGAVEIQKSEEEGKDRAFGRKY